VSEPSVSEPSASDFFTIALWTEFVAVFSGEDIRKLQM
jgi:hypothetical protein